MNLNNFRSITIFRISTSYWKLWILPRW